MPWLFVALLSVSLSHPFGEASARLIGFTPDVVTVELSVEVLEPAAAVLMRGRDSTLQELDLLALLPRDDGTWGAVVELPARRDLRIGFELIPERGNSTVSETVPLADLGIDAALLSLPRPEPTDVADSPPGIGWGIVGLVAALLALLLLAVWSRLGATESASAGERSGEVATDAGSPEETTAVGSDEP